MACPDTVLGEVHQPGYAHHIQRLMVLGNYGLTSGLGPQAFTAGFRRMFIRLGYGGQCAGDGPVRGWWTAGKQAHAVSGSYVNRTGNWQLLSPLPL